MARRYIQNRNIQNDKVLKKIIENLVEGIKRNRLSNKKREDLIEAIYDVIRRSRNQEMGFEEFLKKLQ